jgi:hypothetical protein
VCALVRPVSALRRFNELAEGADHLDGVLPRLLPSALEEARLFDQERELRALLRRIEPSSTG